MYLVFSVGCLVLAGGSLLFAWRLSREAKRLREAIVRKDADLFEANAVAKDFQAAGKRADERAGKLQSALDAAEEHTAAERGRADRLAAALQESEDKVDALTQARHALEEKLMAEHERAEHYKGEAETWKHLNYAAEGRAAREIVNILSYNGSDEGQVELNG